MLVILVRTIVCPGPLLKIRNVIVTLGNHGEIDRGSGTRPRANLQLHRVPGLQCGRGDELGTEPEDSLAYLSKRFSNSLGDDFTAHAC